MSTTVAYRELSEKIFDQVIIEQKKPAVLVFGAEWSGNSEIMHSMMERVSQEFASQLDFYKVDLEKQAEISRFLGVSEVPTTIMLRDGEIVNLIRGFLPAGKMRKQIRNIYSIDNQ